MSHKDPLDNWKTREQWFAENRLIKSDEVSRAYIEQGGIQSPLFHISQTGQRTILSQALGRSPTYVQYDDDDDYDDYENSHDRDDPDWY